MSAGQNKANKFLLHGLLVLLATITLVPYAWLIIASLKSQDDFFSGMFFPPGDGFLGIGWDNRRCLYGGGRRN